MACRIGRPYIIYAPLFLWGGEAARSFSDVSGGWAADVVAVGGKELAHFVEVFALDDYLAVLGGSTDAAAALKSLAEGLEVVVGAYEACDEGDGLAATVVAVEADAQTLLGRRQGLGLGFVVVLVLVIGVGRVDHPYGFVLAHRMRGRSSCFMSRA